MLKIDSTRTRSEFDIITLFARMREHSSLRALALEVEDRIMLEVYSVVVK